MTASILQPGDSIHIAFPYNATNSSMANGAEVARLQAEVEKFYASQGVSIFCFSANGNLIAPQIIAIVRNPV